MRRNVLYEKQTEDVKRKQFKNLSSKIWYSQTSQILNLRKKVASQYDVSNAFLPETTPFKEKFPKLQCKNSVSYNDSLE